ncbi:hypothetical protein TELCIR_17425, partial [Teladorsagia circumcincta]
REWALQWVIPFAETSLRMAVEFFTATVAYPEVIRSLVVVDIVKVMNDFVRDWNGIGDLRLPRGRITEITSALQAVDSLIGRLAREPSQSELYSQLVSLYPSVVDVVGCTRSDPLLESQLIATLKSYQTLLLLQAVPKLLNKES